MGLHFATLSSANYSQNVCITSTPLRYKSREWLVVRQENDIERVNFFRVACALETIYRESSQAPHLNVSKVDTPF